MTKLSSPGLLRAFIALAIVAASAAASASVPALMNYQGKLTTMGGPPVADGTYNMRFYLYDAETSGSELWMEPSVGTRPIAVNGGVFNAVLGSLVPLPSSAFQGSTWLATEVNGSLLAGRVQIVSVGYAQRALLAEGVVPNGVNSAMIANGTITGEDVQVPFVISGNSAALNGLVEGRNAGNGIGVLGQARGGSGSVPGVGGGVFGDSSSGPGVIGYSNTAHGVFGENLANHYYGYLGGTSYGVFGGGTPNLSYAWLSGRVGVEPIGIFAYADSSGKAGYFNGSVRVTGEVLGSGGTGLPIASAYIGSTGPKYKGSANLTSIWDAATKRYHITIAGVDYFYTDFVPVITPVTPGLTVSVGSVDGKLTVEFRNSAGTSVQSSFSVLVFRLL